MLLANRGNISMYWLFFNHVTSLLIQPRQTGKSVSVDSLMISLLNYYYRTYIHLFTKDDGLRVKIFLDLKLCKMSYHLFLILRLGQDANNTEALSIRLLEESLCYISTTSK